MHEFRRITLFCLEKRLSKHKITIISKNLGGHGPFGPPGYAHAQQKTFTNYYALFPSQKAVSPLRGLQPRWPLVLRSLPLPHAFFKSMYTWKSSQYYIIISMMTSFMCVSQKLVFPDSKCICAINHILSTTAMYVSSSSFMYLSIPCYCDACLNSSLLRVGVKMLLNTIAMICLW